MTAWWPQSIVRVLTQQWQSLQSRHWFPRGSRAGSLPQLSENRGEKNTHLNLVEHAVHKCIFQSHRVNLRLLHYRSARFIRNSDLEHNKCTILHGRRLHAGDTEASDSCSDIASRFWICRNRRDEEGIFMKTQSSSLSAYSNYHWWVLRSTCPLSLCTTLSAAHVSETLSAPTTRCWWMWHFTITQHLLHLSQDNVHLGRRCVRRVKGHLIKSNTFSAFQTR